MASLYSKNTSKNGRNREQLPIFAAESDVEESVASGSQLQFDATSTIDDTGSLRSRSLESAASAVSQDEDAVGLLGGDDDDVENTSLDSEAFDDMLEIGPPAQVSVRTTTTTTATSSKSPRSCDKASNESRQLPTVDREWELEQRAIFDRSSSVNNNINNNASGVRKASPTSTDPDSAFSPSNNSAKNLLSVNTVVALNDHAALRQLEWNRRCFYGWITMLAVIVIVAVVLAVVFARNGKFS